MNFPTGQECGEHTARSTRDKHPRLRVLGHLTASPAIPEVGKRSLWSSVRASQISPIGRWHVQLLFLLSWIKKLGNCTHTLDPLPTFGRVTLHSPPVAASCYVMLLLCHVRHGRHGLYRSLVQGRFPQLIYMIHDAYDVPNSFHRTIHKPWPMGAETREVITLITLSA